MLNLISLILTGVILKAARELLEELRLDRLHRLFGDNERGKRNGEG